MTAGCGLWIVVYKALVCGEGIRTAPCGDDGSSQVEVVVAVGDEVVAVDGDYHPVYPGPGCEASYHSYGSSVHDLHIAQLHL